MLKSFIKLLLLFESIINKISTIIGIIASLGIFISAIIITEGVITRKLFQLSGIWQIELAVFLLIFSCFMGAAFVQKEEHHINVDLLLIHLSVKFAEILLIIVSILSCILCAILAVYAWPIWWEALSKNTHSSSLWGPPLWIPYLFLPLGMTLLFFQYLVQIIKKIMLVKEGKLKERMERSELKDININIPYSGQR